MDWIADSSPFKEEFFANCWLPECHGFLAGRFTARTSLLTEMEDGMRIDESMSEYVEFFSRSVRNVFGEDQDSLIFLEVRDGPWPALQASFVLYEYWQIVFGYEDGVFGFEIPFRTSSSAVLLGPTKEWTLNDLEGVLREVDRRVRLRIPDKYLAAREGDQGGEFADESSRLRCTVIEARHIDEVANALWEPMSSDLLASFGGEVSIAKFLGKPSEEQAQQSWTVFVSRQLHELPDGIRETMQVDPHSATLRLSGEVTARFGLGEVTVAIAGSDVWEASLRPGVSVVLVSAIGWSRWGERWRDQLHRLRPEGGPIVDSQDGSHLPWIAQRPDEPGPWTRARSEADAVLISDAEALGVPGLREVYEELNRG